MFKWMHIVIRIRELSVHTILIVLERINISLVLEFWKMILNYHLIQLNVTKDTPCYIPQEWLVLLYTQFHNGFSNYRYVMDVI